MQKICAILFSGTVSPSRRTILESLNVLSLPPIVLCYTQMVAYTMEAVCILFGSKPNWKESKNLLSKMTFMDELKVRHSRRDGSRGKGDIVTTHGHSW